MICAWPTTRRCGMPAPVMSRWPRSISSPTQWRQHKLAPVRQRFMLAQVDVLGRELAALGIPLHLLRVETFAGAGSAGRSLPRAGRDSALRQSGHRDRRAASGSGRQRRAGGADGGLPLAQRLLRAAARAGADRLWRNVQSLYPFSRAWLKALDEDGFVIHRAPSARGEPLPWQPLVEWHFVDAALGELTADPRWPVGRPRPAAA